MTVTPAEAKCTPGPWRAIPPPTSNNGGVYFAGNPWFIDNGAGRRVAIIPRPINQALTGYMPESSRLSSSDTQEANALLIAAAPELLQACRQLLNAIDSGEHPALEDLSTLPNLWAAYNAATEAIGKAVLK